MKGRPCSSRKENDLASSKALAVSPRTSAIAFGKELCPTWCLAADKWLVELPRCHYLVVAGVEQASMLVQIGAGEGQRPDKVLLTEGVYDEEGDIVAWCRSFFWHRKSGSCKRSLTLMQRDMT